jgi:hypothetical protein
MRRSSLVLLLSLLSSSVAAAHDWYPSECCSGKDCHQVPCDQIHAEGMGSYWYQGEFSRGARIHFPKSYDKSPAPDGMCHVCINSATVIPNGICIYVGGGV